MVAQLKRIGYFYFSELHFCPSDSLWLDFDLIVINKLVHYILLQFREIDEMTSFIDLHTFKHRVSIIRENID